MIDVACVTYENSTASDGPHHFCRHWNKHVWQSHWRILACFPFGCRLCCCARSLGRLVHVWLSQCVAHCDVPRDELSSSPRKYCDTVKSLPISSKQAWRLFQRRNVRLRHRSPHQVVQAMMPCGATVAPSARQTMQSSCVNRHSARALVRLAYVCSQSKSNSDVDGAVVESQAAAGQWKCVQPVTAVGWCNWQQPSSVCGVAQTFDHRLHSDGQVYTQIYTTATA